jgi:hypothetical protein
VSLPTHRNQISERTPRPSSKRKGQVTNPLIGMRIAGLDRGCSRIESGNLT